MVSRAQALHLQSLRPTVWWVPEFLSNGGQSRRELGEVGCVAHCVGVHEGNPRAFLLLYLTLFLECPFVKLEEEILLQNLKP